MSTVSTVAIAGITGTLARLITKHLLDRPNVHINGLCRNPAKLPKNLRSDPRLTLFKSEADDIKTIREAVKGAEVVICCYLGDHSLMVDGQKALIDASIAEGVPRYIAGDWSMDFRKLAYGEHPPKDPMKEIQEYLEEKSDHIKAVHVLNACFLERPWVGLWDSKKQSFKYWGTGEERWEFTTYANAAEFTAEVALDKEANGWLSCESGSSFRYMLTINAVRGDHKNMKEIAEDFKAVYNQEPELEQLGSLEDLYKLMHETKNRDANNVWAWLGL